jgi:hypothetical protein
MQMTFEEACEFLRRVALSESSVVEFIRDSSAEYEWGWHIRIALALDERHQVEEDEVIVSFLVANDQRCMPICNGPASMYIAEFLKDAKG